MKFAAQRHALSRLEAGDVVVVEKTALAEAEVEYEDYTSDTVWVKFPVARSRSATERASAAIEALTAARRS